MSESLPSDLPVRQSSGLTTVVVVIVILALIVSGLWYWRANRPSQGGWAGGGPIDVRAKVLEAGAAAVTLQALGELRAVRQVMLSAEVAGRVATISFEPGQQVKAGTVLVTIDDSVEQADLAAARAQASFTQQQYARGRELVGVGAMAREIFQQREAERDQAAAQVKQLQARIANKRIRAPFDGQLGLRHIDLGQYLTPGDAAVTLTDIDHLYANFDVPQEALPSIKIGQTVQVSTDATGDDSVQAIISAIEPQVRRDTRSASIQAQVDNTSGHLQSGMFATVVVLLPPEPNAIIVPVSAVITSASGDSAVVVRELSAENIGKAEIVPIVVGRTMADSVVVAQGLQAGDVVVTEGQLRVRPGADVHVLDQSTALGMQQTGYK